MIDLRYHIATVAALFLALGIGIFIGSTVISDDLLMKEQEHLIVLLEKEFDKLRDDNRFLKENVASLQENLYAYDEIGREILPLIAQERLTDKQIGLLITNPAFNAEDFSSLFTGIGIEQAYNITITNDFFAYNQNETIVSDIIHSIKDIITKDYEKKGELVETKFIKASGDFSKQIDYLLVIGGGTKENSDFSKVLDYPLIKEIINVEVPIIGVETSNVEFSYIPTYQALGIPTIDDLDTFLGKINLLKLLGE